MADLVSVAGAVASELSRYGATVCFLPEFKLSELSQMRVVVVPTGIEDELATRDSVGAVYKVSVGVLKKTTEDEIPSLVQTVRSIGRHFLGMHLAGCSCVKAAYEPIYSPEQFREKRQFTGVVVLSFRTVERLLVNAGGSRMT